MVATLRAAQEAADVMGVQIAGLQESLQVMETRVREWDKSSRELQWEQEKGQLQGSVDDEKARSVRLAQAKEEVERGLHELQGKFVDLEMGVSKGVQEVEGLRAKSRELVGNSMQMSSFVRAAQREIEERQKELELLKKAKGDSAFVPIMIGT